MDQKSGANLAENKIMPQSTGPLLCIEVSKLVTRESYLNLYLPALEKIYREYNQVFLLFYYPDPENFPGWQEDAAHEDFLHSSKSGKMTKKVALVNAPDPVSKRWELLRPLLGGDVRNFTDKEFEAALTWVKNDDA